ncbi:MAG: PA0069 family radical SAM protein [Cytophagaceae bacterium]|nr:PA0069 family radical SAM protein [Cytophagaceae bacterium]MDW8457331.1 PA0069 family radical SAM protein [Cytophagaceae bacterium]
MSGIDKGIIKGRGAQYNSVNPYDKQYHVVEHIEGIDEPMETNPVTKFFEDFPKKIINKVESPDLGLMYSMNPYQGCEHGCIYCYARNSHQYWGFSAGMDFESRIIIKKNAPTLLSQQLSHKNWEPHPIMLSGNTDCYQPIERKLKLTRRMLEVLLSFRNPVSIITKNSLVLRDIDILREMASMNLVHVNISIASLNEEIRQKLEPRTATYAQRLKVIEHLSKASVPVNVMVAPVIPGLTNYEIPEIIKQAADRGALSAAYTIVRLNGSIAEIFTDWLKKAYPDRFSKVLNLIKQCHGGQLNDSRFGRRIMGEGNIAASIADIFHAAINKYMNGKQMPAFNLQSFNRETGKGQLNLF